jgi:hypothetical protein
MTAALLAEPALRNAAELAVDRQDIVFHDVAPSKVQIEIALHNQADGASPSQVAYVSAAPLGAFVPWQPLEFFQVPRLEPGQSHTIRFTAVRPAVNPLGPPDRVPPRRLLTALGAADDRPGALPRLGDFLNRLVDRITGGADPKTLPADPMALLARGNPHWAGNLNIFVGRKAVERHLAQALRIYPGRTNLAMFVVGQGCDAYRFSVHCEQPNWETALFDLSEADSFRLDKGRGVELGRWLEQRSMHLMMLMICPPLACSRGTVEVEVEQRSTGQSAIVEFSLDPKAAGPGCYVV